MGNLLLVFHFSIRFVVGLWGMWESRSDFQGLWKAGVLSISPSFPQARFYSVAGSVFAFLACSTR